MKKILKVISIILIGIFLILEGVIFSYQDNEIKVLKKESKTEVLFKEGQQTYCDFILDQEDTRGVDWFNRNGFIKNQKGDFLKEEEASRMVWFSELPKCLDFYGIPVTVENVQMFERKETNEKFFDWIYINLNVSSLNDTQIKEFIKGTETKSGLDFLISSENGDFKYESAYLDEGHIYFGFTRQSNKKYNGEQISIIIGQQFMDYSLFYCFDGRVNVPIKSIEEAPCYSLVGENLKNK